MNYFYNIKMSFASITFILSHVYGGVFRGDWLLQQVECRIRYENPAAFCSADINARQTCKTMPLFLWNVFVLNVIIFH